MKKGPAKKKAPTPKRKYTKRTRETVLNMKSKDPARVVVSDAEATIKHAIFDGIVDQWHKKNESNFAVIARDKIFETIFRPEFRWALEEHLQSLK